MNKIRKAHQVLYRARGDITHEPKSWKEKFDDVQMHEDSCRKNALKRTSDIMANRELTASEKVVLDSMAWFAHTQAIARVREHKPKYEGDTVSIDEEHCKILEKCVDMVEECSNMPPLLLVKEKDDFNDAEVEKRVFQEEDEETIKKTI